MSDERTPVELEELEKVDGEQLPDREAMMLIDPSGQSLLGPPDLADAGPAFLGPPEDAPSDPAEPADPNV